jgi:hypothetical protein
MSNSSLQFGVVKFWVEEGGEDINDRIWIEVEYEIYLALPLGAGTEAHRDSVSTRLIDFPYFTNAQKTTLRDLLAIGHNASAAADPRVAE